MPIVGKIEDGSASDKKINHRLLSEVSAHMHKHGLGEDAFIYIVDSAMVTEANLAQAGERIRFIKRLPATYKEHERVIGSAIDANRWQEVGAELRASTSAYHRLDVQAHESPRYGPGRPKKSLPRIPVAINYVLQIEICDKREAVARARQMAGCFVLLSNLPPEGESGYGAEKILRVCKDQNGIERNYSFLKDDQIVNALFLKRPECIEALGLILLISLLIWQLIELVMRFELQARQTTVPGWDNKPTARPTAYMVTWKFKGVLVVCVGEQRLLARPLTDTQLAFLQVLQVPESCFTQHPRDG